MASVNIKDFLLGVVVSLTLANEAQSLGSVFCLLCQ